MKIYQTHEQMYAFKHLPAYATYLLHHHLDDYVRESVRLSHEVQLPLLKRLSHLSDEQQLQLSRMTSAEFLTCLSENKAKDYVEGTLKRWQNDQLPILGKYDVNAEDITIINYVRNKVLKHWLHAYSTDIDLILNLNAEIDLLVLGQNTTSANAYIQMLKERIEEELHFSQNVINASPGITFIFDIATQKEIYINGKVEEVMGYAPEEITKLGGDMIDKLTHPEDRSTVIALLKDLMNDSDGKTYQAEYRFKNKRGTYRWLRTYSVVYKRDLNGVPTQVLGASFEISNEKEIGRLLMKREQQLLEAQAIAHIGSYEWDIVQDTSVSTPELRNIFEANKRQSLPPIF